MNGPFWKRFSRGAVLIIASLGLGCGGAGEPEAVGSVDQALSSLALPNNLPVPNSSGFAASFSTQGSLHLDDEFFQPQGTNGRTCATCHLLQDGWSIRPSSVRRFFEETGGLHPIFANNLDANFPSAPSGTLEERRSSFSMLLQGKFIRRVNVAASAEYSMIESADPFGESNLVLMQFFRRPLPTANFKSHVVMWDGANTVGTDLQAGLDKQAKGNVTGAQQGSPAPQEVIDQIVLFEKQLSVAQLFVPGAWFLNAGGAKGGPAHHAEQPLVAGRFSLYDAWRSSTNPYRAQIARGQEIFNGTNAANGRSCNGCHSAANDGQNVAGVLFNIGTSKPEHARSDMAIFTLQHKITGEILRTTDGGQGIRTGKWADLNRFKAPSLRGAAARAPYFHNGIATSLREVVRFYEANLGFQFSNRERDDLVAFLSAL